MPKEGKISYNASKRVLMIPFLALSDHLRNDLLNIEHLQAHHSVQERVKADPLIRIFCAKVAMGAYLHNDAEPIIRKGQDSGVDVEFTQLINRAWRYGGRLGHLERFSSAAANQPHIWVKMPKRGRYVRLHLSKPVESDLKIELGKLAQDRLAFRKHLSELMFG
ncbi:MAG: hypothetical protein AABX01_00210 [Candidatus Micrarchaeota archaeon]